MSKHKKQSKCAEKTLPTNVHPSVWQADLQHHGSQHGPSKNQEQAALGLQQNKA